MASHVLGVYYTPSSSVYFRIRNSAGLWLDFSDSTFKAWASATTPYIAATASALQGGTEDYAYAATIDLDDLNSGPDVETFIVEACVNATPAITDDLVSEAQALTVQAGEVSGGPVSVAMFDGVFTTTAGTTFRAIAWLEIDGRFTALASGSCSIAVREQGAGADLFVASAAAVNGDGAFDLSQSSPGFTNDRVYAATVTITKPGGETVTSRHSMQVQAA